MDNETRGLLEAIRDAMALTPSQKREDATCAVYAVLHVLLADDRPPSVASQARWLREELAAIEDGGGSPTLARRTITGLISWDSR